jgi:hypothetical protein
VEPIFDKGVDERTMDEARVLLVVDLPLPLFNLFRYMLTSFFFDLLLCLQRRILDAFVRKFRTVKRAISQVLTFDNKFISVCLSPWQRLNCCLVTS